MREWRTIAATMRAWLRKIAGLTRREPRFAFRVSPVPLIDGDLELVEPSARWIDAVLLTTRSPACAGDPCAATTRGELLRFLDQFPRGRQRANAFRAHANGYTFWMRLRGAPGDGDLDGFTGMAGSISLRIGDDENLRCYLGHVGYGVYPPARGRHLAERAVRLLYPLARAHGLRELWITANPENAASRRTCERLGGEFHGVVDLPALHPLALRGEVRKCRYRIDLDAGRLRPAGQAG